MITNQKIRPIEGTPFATVEKGENKLIVIWGKFKITEKTFFSHGAAEKWAKQTDWLPILNVVGIYFDYKWEEIQKNLKN